MLWLYITSIISEPSLTLPESILEHFPSFSELPFFSQRKYFFFPVLQLHPGITSTAKMAKMRKEERQPLLLNNTEPLNDTYDKGPIPRPDVRTSPDSMIVHLPAHLESSGPMDIKPSYGNNVGDSHYNLILNRDLEHPIS